jgi:hypothetical protein
MKQDKSMTADNFDPRINISALPLEMREHPDFLKKLNHLSRSLDEPRTVEEACTHDAGHLHPGISPAHIPVTACLDTVVSRAYTQGRSPAALAFFGGPYASL